MKQLMKLAAAAAVGAIASGTIVYAQASPPPPRAIVSLYHAAPGQQEALLHWFAGQDRAARAAGVAPMISALLAIWFSADALARDDAGVRYVRETLARCPGEGYALACEALKAADLRALAPSIAARTLVVCGDDDIPSFLEAARCLAAEIPQAELAWLKGAKHASVLEQPEAARRLMRTFLRG